MTGRRRALLRLFALQAAWNTERMQGVGMGWAAEPLLDDLRTADPTRHAEAVVRSAEFFNGNPNLAGLALGATVRAEYDGVPGAQVLRLRTALCGPLGSLGDRLFWAGVVPALVGVAVAAVALGGGWVVVASLVLAYATVRAWVVAWSLDTGLRQGLKVGSALTGAWLPRAAERVGPAAGFGVGLALPLAARWLLAGSAPAARQPVATVLVVVVGLVLAFRAGPRYTALRYGLAVLTVAALLAAFLGGQG